MYRLFISLVLLIMILLSLSFKVALMNQQSEKQEWYDILQLKIANTNSERMLNHHTLVSDRVSKKIINTKRSIKFIDYLTVLFALTWFSFTLIYLRTIGQTITRLHRKERNFTKLTFYRLVRLSIILFIISWFNYIFFPLSKVVDIYITRDTSEWFSISLFVLSILVLQFTTNVVQPNLKINELAKTSLPIKLFLLYGVISFFSLIYVSITNIDLIIE